MKTHHGRKRFCFRCIAPVMLVVMVFAFCPISAAAAGGYDVTSFESIIAVGLDGGLAVTEMANITSPGASRSVDFFIPSQNFTGESRPPVEKADMQGAVAVDQAACLIKGTKVVYSLSSTPGANSYTVSQGQAGATVSLAPAPQADRDNTYIITYTRDRAITKYDDVAELDLVLVSRGEYGGAVGQSNIYIQFPSGIDLDEMEVYVHGANRWEYGPGDVNTLFGITAYGVQPGGLLEVRVLMPLSYVPDCANTAPGLARQAIQAQEKALGQFPLEPSPLDPWMVPAIGFVLWLLASIALYVAYLRLWFPRRRETVTAPPSALPPALASRLLSPMGMDPCVLLSVFLNLVRAGLLSLAHTGDEEGHKSFRFTPTGKSSVFAMKHEKALLEWISADAGYDGVSAREMKSASLRRPGRYYHATNDVMLHLINDATDCGLLRDAPRAFRWLWILLAIGLAAVAVVYVFLGRFEPLVLLLPAVFTLVFRQYTRKVPSEKSMQETVKWRAYAAWLASGGPSGESSLESVEDGFIYSVALGVSGKYVGMLEKVQVPQMESSAVLAPFMVDGRFSVRLYRKLLSSFRFASFFSAALRSSIIRSARRETYDRIKKK